MLLHLNSMSDICQPQIYEIGISNQNKLCFNFQDKSKFF